MNNIGYYGNPDLAPFDAAFKTQIQAAATNGAPGNILNQIVTDWEQQKLQLVQSTIAKYRNLGGYTETVVQNLVNNFIRTGLNAYLYRTTPQPQFGMPMGAMGMSPYFGNNMNQNPFMGGGMIGNNTIYQPMMSSANQMQQAPVQYANIENRQEPTNVQEQTQEVKNKNDILTVISNPEYKEPVLDDADELYGTEEHSTCLGTIKVIPMVSSNGYSFNHVIINLSRPCLNDEEALQYAQRIYTKTSKPVHMDISYDKIYTIDVPYEDSSRVFAELKKSIPTSSKAHNKLKYLQNIQKLLNTESRGVADGIEDWLIEQFMVYGRFGCCDSDTMNGLKINSIYQLIQLSSKETTDEQIQTWQNVPGFHENLTNMCNQTIKWIITKGKILNPSNISDLDTILRSRIGLMETSSGDLIDIVSQINPKRTEFAKASHEEKRTLFGEAGSMLTNSTTIVVPGTHLVYTNLMHDGMVGRKDDSLVVITKDLIIGGFTKDQANNCDTDFEYMITRVSFAEDIGNVIVGYDKYIHVKYIVTRSTDKWHRINRA